MRVTVAPPVKVFGQPNAVFDRREYRRLEPVVSSDRGGGQGSWSFAPDSVDRFVELVEKAGAIAVGKRRRSTRDLPAIA